MNQNIYPRIIQYTKDNDLITPRFFSISPVNQSYNRYILYFDQKLTGIVSLLSRFFNFVAVSME